MGLQGLDRVDASMLPVVRRDRLLEMQGRQAFAIVLRLREAVGLIFLDNGDRGVVASESV